MELKKSIKSFLSGVYTSKYGLIFLLVVFALVVFPAGINRNRPFVMFAVALGVVMLYAIPQKLLRLFIFALFVFIIISPVSLPRCAVVTDMYIDAYRWQTVTDGMVKHYTFKASDFKRNGIFGEIPAFLLIQGKNLKDMEYTIDGITGPEGLDLIPYASDELLRIPLDLSAYKEDIHLVIKPRKGTSFELFRGTEVDGRKRYFDAIYIQQENACVRIIYYPNLESDIGNPFPSYRFPREKRKKHEE